MNGNLKSAGFYVVVHFGPDGKENLPCYLVSPERGFSFSRRRAKTYDYREEAERDLEKVDSALRKKNHELAGKVYVSAVNLEIYTLLSRSRLVYCRRLQTKGKENGEVHARRSRSDRV